ncbi:uncharacterized protein BXZ73DRAFT_40800 [Epithele typhae]|uniref:uncharacterized protein n=1 Tax=Epithele typhae TaxID=378194 RepID=UPI00200847A4|nr:uncharacterized protein BXZ73DRAFT_40800 [Epithele typhae]KAH9943380.1 hypothetical protein BXZ73DRAFT_40800 [Epithele typhae]
MLRNATKPLASAARSPQLLIRAASTASATPAKTRPYRQKANAASPPSSLPPSSRTGKNQAFRRKKSSTGGEEIRLLSPYVLSQRLRQIIGEKGLDEAVAYLQSMPRDAQNTPVWNLVIKEAGAVGRCKLAYKLYIDMKRRHFKPNTRTFSALAAGLATVTDWENHPSLLELAHSAFDDYWALMQEIKTNDSTSPELALNPFNAFLRLFTKAKQWQKALDLYNSLDDEGPLSPTHFTYSAVILALEMPGERLAADIRHLWRQIQKRIDNGADTQLDAHVLTPLVSALTGGRSADHIMAFDIVRTYVGYAQPGDQVPATPPVALSSHLFFTILTLCFETQKYRRCIQFLRKAMVSDQRIIDFRHLNLALRACHALAMQGSLYDASDALQLLEWAYERSASFPAHDPRDELVRTAQHTTTLAICAHTTDWPAALRVFQLITGHAPEDFADGAPARPARPSPPARGHLPREVYPQGLTYFVRTALSTDDPAVARQCLRLVDAVGLRRVLGRDRVRLAGGDEGGEMQQTARFFGQQATMAVVALANAALHAKADVDVDADDAEARRWRTLRKLAHDLVPADSKKERRPSSVLEERPRVTTQELKAMDQDVKLDMITRDSKIRRS